MATFQAANTSFAIPDAGEVFTSSGDPNKIAVYARVGDEIKSFGLQDLGAQLMPKGDGRQQLAAAKNYLSQQGIDVNSLPEKNFADVQSAFGSKGKISAVTDFSQFQDFIQQAATTPTANPGGDIINFGADRTLAFTNPEGQSLVVGGGTTTKVPGTFDNPLVLDANGKRLNQDQPLSNAPNTKPVQMNTGIQNQQSQTTQPVVSPYTPKGITSANEFLDLAGISTASQNIQNFLDNRKTASNILAEVYKERGIEEQQSILKDLDARIRKQEDVLRDLPKAVQSSLSDVGVTQAQLTRLQAREAKKPTELLNELLRERNALASEINTAMDFAQKFVDSQMEDQATKLAALKFSLDRAEGDYARMEAKRKEALGLALDEQKDIMNIALDAEKAGADSADVKKILDAKSIEDAIRARSEIEIPQSSFDIRSIAGGGIIEVERNAQGQVIGTKTVVPSATNEEISPQITAQDAEQMGFPPEIAGMTKAQLTQDMQNSLPPKWFRTMAEGQMFQSLTPTALQKMWNDFRGSANSASAGKTGELSFDDF